MILFIFSFNHLYTFQSPMFFTYILWYKEGQWALMDPQCRTYDTFDTLSLRYSNSVQHKNPCARSRYINFSLPYSNGGPSGISGLGMMRLVTALNLPIGETQVHAGVTCWS